MTTPRQSQPSSPDAGPAPVALVTGAGSGIGRATAVLLSRHGYRLALVGRRVHRLHDTAALLRSPWAVIPVDLADPSHAEAMIDRAASEFGRIDALINNAGYSLPATIPETTLELTQAVFAINAISPAVAVSRVWPILERQARTEGRGGVIVNVSSYATIDPFPTLYAYAAAKASVNLLAKSIAGLGAAVGIRGFAVAPGAVETELLRTIVDQDHLPTRYTLAPQQVAEVIVACVLGRHDDRNGEVILIPSPSPTTAAPSESAHRDRTL